MLGKLQHEQKVLYAQHVVVNMDLHHCQVFLSEDRTELRHVRYVNVGLDVGVR